MNLTSKKRFSRRVIARCLLSGLVVALFFAGNGPALADCHVQHVVGIRFPVELRPDAGAADSPEFHELRE